MGDVGEYGFEAPRARSLIPASFMPHRPTSEGLDNAEFDGHFDDKPGLCGPHVRGLQVGTHWPIPSPSGVCPRPNPRDSLLSPVCVTSMREEVPAFNFAKSFALFHSLAGGCRARAGGGRGRGLHSTNHQFSSTRTPQGTPIYETPHLLESSGTSGD